MKGDTGRGKGRRELSVWVETVSQCKAVVLVIQVTRSACDGRSVRPYIDILHQGKPA